jgi:hypothetical protein
MGVKRFLVVGGMASLVLIGVVLLDDAKSIARDNNLSASSKLDPSKLDPSKLDPSKLDPSKLDPSKLDPSKLDPSKLDPSKLDPRNPEPANPEPANPEPANPPPPQEEVASMGMGNMGDQQAPSGDVQGAGGAGNDGGAGGVLATMTDLPETGGLPVVLLLTSAFLLGSGLLMVAIVRSVRS